MGKQYQQKYVHNVARTIMGQIGGIPYCHANLYSASQARFPDLLWENYGDKVAKILLKMGPEARGRIAACGGTSTTAPNNCSLYAITGSRHHGSRMDTDNEVLTMLAAYVVIAAIADIIRARVGAHRDEGMRPYIDEAHHSAVHI